MAMKLVLIRTCGKKSIWKKFLKSSANFRQYFQWLLFILKRPVIKEISSFITIKDLFENKLILALFLVTFCLIGHHGIEEHFLFKFFYFQIFFKDFFPMNFYHYCTKLNQDFYCFIPKMSALHCSFWEANK